MYHNLINYASLSFNISKNANRLHCHTQEENWRQTDRNDLALFHMFLNFNVSNLTKYTVRLNFLFTLKCT